MSESRKGRFAPDLTYFMGFSSLEFDIPQPRERWRNLSSGIGFILVSLVGIAPQLLAQTSPIDPDGGIPGYRIETRGPHPGDPHVAWDIITATAEADEMAPPDNLRDFSLLTEPSLLSYSASAECVMDASSGLLTARIAGATRNIEFDPKPVWSFAKPATLTLHFNPTFLLEQVWIKAASRTLGVSNFEVVVSSATDTPVSKPQVVGATVALGRDLQDGFRWKLEVEPVQVGVFHLRFMEGVAQEPDSLGISRLDLWGRDLSEEEPP